MGGEGTALGEAPRALRDISDNLVDVTARLGTLGGKIEVLKREAGSLKNDMKGEMRALKDELKNSVKEAKKSLNDRLEDIEATLKL
jgi:predicted  nucleic acid-binding Zn-ribbon protein